MTPAGAPQNIQIKGAARQGGVLRATRQGGSAVIYRYPSLFLYYWAAGGTYPRHWNPSGLLSFRSASYRNAKGGSLRLRLACSERK